MPVSQPGWAFTGIVGLLEITQVRRPPVALCDRCYAIVSNKQSYALQRADPAFGAKGFACNACAHVSVAYAPARGYRMSDDMQFAASNWKS